MILSTLSTRGKFLRTNHASHAKRGRYGTPSLIKQRRPRCIWVRFETILSISLRTWFSFICVQSHQIIWNLWRRTDCVRYRTVVARKVTQARQTKILSRNLLYCRRQLCDGTYHQVDFSLPSLGIEESRREDSLLQAFLTAEVILENKPKLRNMLIVQTIAYVVLHILCHRFQINLCKHEIGDDVLEKHYGSCIRDHGQIVTPTAWANGWVNPTWDLVEFGKSL